MSLLPRNKRHFFDNLAQFPTAWENFPSLWHDFSDEFMVSGLNVYEDRKNNLIVEAEIPGFKEDEVHVDFKDGVLWISAEKNEEEEDKERTYFKKTMSTHSYRYTLPVQVDEKTEPEASIQDGILQIKFRKGQGSESKKISVKSKKGKTS